MENKEKKSQLNFNDWVDDPSSWKLGIFYYNKNDKRLFPPRKIRWAGWTVNFANPYSILAGFGLIILVCAIIDILR